MDASNLRFLSDLSPRRERSEQIHRDYPFYRYVPKDLAGNLSFRQHILTLAYTEPKFKEELWIMCRRDPLFYFNTFGYVYDPRAHNAGFTPVRPFITYAFQDVVFEEIFKSIDNGYDMLSEKSRDMGLSWMFLLAIEHRWHFYSYLSFRLVSRNEDLVDDAKNPDSLFWKIDHFHKFLPKFLRPSVRPKVDRTHMSMSNPVTGSTMVGCTTTGDVARGGRCTAMLLDEFAAVDNGHEILSSTRDVTRCRLFNSTHKGTGTAFYALGKTNIKKLTCHWSLHETKNVGLYYWDGKKIVIVNPYSGTVQMHDGETVEFAQYPFIRDGKLRSPWYDVECERSSHPMEIAQELDIDPFASDSMFFDVATIDKITETQVKEPYWRGELTYDENTLEPIDLIENPKGKLLLWTIPIGKKVETAQYAMGIDISAGTGASNSSTSIGNKTTGEKVAEYTSPDIHPEQWARLNVALAKLFHNAYMIWDGGGPGRIFADCVINLGYRNVYYKRPEDTLDKKVSMKPGCFLNNNEKLSVLGAYRKALKDGAFTQRSREANLECLQYVFTTGNTVEHASCRTSVDPSGAQSSHGDRVIADALLNRGFTAMGTPVKTENEYKTKYNFYARHKEWEDKQRALESSWM